MASLTENNKKFPFDLDSRFNILLESQVDIFPTDKEI